MPAISPYHSRLFYGTKPNVPADGQTEVAVKVRILDVNERPVSGVVVTLSADTDVTITQPTELTDARGYTFGLVSSITPGTVQITAHVTVPESSESSLGSE